MTSHWSTIVISLLLLLAHPSIAAPAVTPSVSATVIASPTATASASAMPPILNVSCADDASVIPNKVFSSDSNKVYESFCTNVNTNTDGTLRFMYNVFGEPNGNEAPSRSRIKRLAYGLFGKREDGPGQFTNWQFELDWAPKEDAEKCYLDCFPAFAVLAATPQCSQKGDDKSLMSASGQIQIGCGTFGYTVRGIAIS